MRHLRSLHRRRQGQDARLANLRLGGKVELSSAAGRVQLQPGALGSEDEMTNYEIDQFYGQTPCVCGATDTWHVDCYKRRTKEQVAEAYRRVYAKLRRRMKVDTLLAAKVALGKAAK